MDEQTKRRILVRLKRAEGQTAAIHRMIEADAYCVDVLTQISAVQGALDRAGSILLGSHIEHCVADAFSNGDAPARQEKIEELLDIFTKYASLRK